MQDFKDSANLPDMIRQKARSDVYENLKALIGTGDPTQEKLQQKNVGGILEQVLGKGSPKSCYDDKTELLTEDGWMLFSDYQGQCKVSTIHPLTQLFEYHQPTAIVHAPYEGPMIETKGRKHLDMLVTPNHRHWVRWREHAEKRQNLSEGWVFETAEEVFRKSDRCHFRHTAEGFEGDRGFPAFVSGDLEAFAELVGWWVAEGWNHPDDCTAYVCQGTNNKEYCDRIDVLASKAGFRYTRAVYQKGPTTISPESSEQVYWGFHSKELVDWLAENCGEGAENKHLSREAGLPST